jgi:phage FluMu gp28-like protein
MKTLLLLILMITAPNLFIRAETQAQREARVASELFLPFQQRWADDRSRIKAIEKCRQAGISWTEAYVAVDESSKAEAKRDTWVSSRDLTQARLFVDDCKYWTKLHKTIATDMGLQVVDEDKDIKAYQIDFATGRTIYSMSSNPDGQAGKRGRRVADEFALHKDQRKLYAIMQPGLQWGGQMALISTHRGTNSFFNREIIAPARDEATNKKKVSLHTITIEQAVAEGLWIKIKSQLERDDDRYHFTDDEWLQSVRDECPDEETWLQEYCCVPADDASAFLTWEDITACGETEAELAAREFPKDAPRYLGFDIARKRDLSVITVLCEIAGTLVLEKLIVMEKTPFSEQQRRLYELMDLPTTRRCAIDASGLGMDLAERAETKYQGRVLPVMFTMKSKAEIAYPLRARFEDRSIRIPCGQSKAERLYTADLRSVKKEVTSAGNIVITSEAGATDGHADRFWSLGLAVYAGSSALPPFAWSPANKPTNESRDHAAEGESRFGLNRVLRAARRLIS